MTDLPLVSLVTPCLNPGSRIAECLASVAAQTYPAVEHIVIDGGSTDGTVELLAASGVMFVSEPDSGQSDAINKGWRMASGSWLGWINADDELLPDAVERVMSAVVDHPNVGWVYGEAEIKLDGQPYLHARPRAEIDEDALEYGGIVPQQGSLIARWALDRVGLVDDQLHLAMDYDLWLRLHSAAIPSLYIPDVLAIFHLHDGAKSIRQGASDFGFERTVSQMKLGMESSAAATLGVAAAAAARGESSLFARERVETEIDRLVGALRARGFDIDVTAVRASAYAEAAIGEFYARPRRFRYLLTREPWLYERPRAKLVRSITRGVARRTRTSLRRGSG